MSAIADGYLENLLAGQPYLPPALPALRWINNLRAEAVDRVGELTVPSPRDEAWRFTDISQLTRSSFQRAQTATTLRPVDIERFDIAEAANRLVFVDGQYAPQLSRTAIDCGVVVTHLAEGGEAHAALVESHLGRHAGFGNNVFAALNTAFLQDAALIIAPRNSAVAAPLHLLFIATQPGVASYPRCLLVAQTGSAVTLIEDYVAMQETAYFTNAVTEISLAEGARVQHVRVQREGNEGFHIANCAVTLDRASSYQSVSMALGARLSRYDLKVLQAAEGAECSIDGLALIAGRQLADTHTYIDHAQPFGVSRQLHKCIVGGAAHAVFNGKIMVRPGAQRTDSSQSSRNLLLSDRAHIDTQPQLEIFADDVKCNHGATVGQLNNEEVFYLTSRGLPDGVARKLLTYAFGAEIIARIPVASLREQLAQAVMAQTTDQP
ncbi:MAG: Fe-S cluster assembly protein SufD [Sterolibacterium sp.]|jgi:Fe-S cluster assembly protein SufD